MKSIHARMDIRIRWENVPTGSADHYTIEMSGVPMSLSLCPREETRSIHATLTPSGDDPSSGDGVYRLRADLRAQQLTGEFTTLRYDAGTIPTVQVFCGEEAVTNSMPLERAFSQWGWDPEAAADQNYKVDMKIMGDGSVEVKEWKDASVEDEPGPGMTKGCLRLGSPSAGRLSPADGSGRGPQSPLPVYRGTALPDRAAAVPGDEGGLTSVGY